MVDESGLGGEQSRPGPAPTRAERRGARPVRRATAADATNPGGLAAGTMVGRYEIVRLVGQGGMGAVYEARDERLGRTVALKVLSPAWKSDRKAAKRFAIEAQAAARLEHPNVVGIHDFDMAGDVPYMAMEFLAGETLAREIGRGPLAAARMADVMLAVCAGVHAAHDAGIVHRDLKPSNIFLCADWTGRETARVLDFGISKVGGLASSRLTRTGDIVGTSQYLSPEQATGQDLVSAASDQYSLGVVMYECMTGRTPHQGLPIHQLLANVIRGVHTPPRQLRPDLSSDLEAIIERAMGLRPQDRFASVHALGKALLPWATPDSQRHFDDFYRAAADRSGPVGVPRARQRSTPVAASSLPVTLPASEPEAGAWMAGATRTSDRRPPSGRRAAAMADEPAPPRTRPGRRLIYSLGLGAALAALTLGVLAALWR